jgi:hypothetical protein
MPADGCTCLAETPYRFDNREGEVVALIYIASSNGLERGPIAAGEAAVLS